MERKHIHILQMGKHFLYLPLYYARARNFFGFLPPDVSVEIDLSDPQTDQGAFQQMMDESPRNRDKVMAICDPVQILKCDPKAKNQPVLLAAVVTNGAFWAVNHGTRDISALRQLGEFKHILAFKPGTTSYTVASRIAQQAGRTNDMGSFIQVVDPGNELLRLNDPTTPENVVALSPDLLMIEELIHAKSAQVELPLGTTPEFNDVLVTGLVSHCEFVTQNPAIVSGILAGLQKALLMIRLRNEDVLRFAEDFFDFPEHVAGGIDKAIAAGVFPLSIVVEQAHWQHAARADYEANQKGAEWNTAQEAQSLECFNRCVRPHIPIVQAAANRVFGAPVIRERNPVALPLGLVAFTATASILLAWATGAVPTFLLVAAFSVAWWIGSHDFMVDRPVLRWIWIVGWVVGGIFAGTPFVNGMPEKAAQQFNTIGFWIMGIAASIPISLYVNVSKKKHD